MPRMLRMTEADLKQRLKGAGKAIAKATPLPKPHKRAQRPLIASQGQDWGTSLILQTWSIPGPAPTSEYRFAPPRRWRFDLAWPDRMLAVEINGGVWIQGRHNRGQGYLNDLEKMNEAQLLGWRVIQVVPEQVKNGQALKLIERALA